MFELKIFENLELFFTILLGKELAPGQNITYDECGCLYGACMYTENRVRQCQCDPGYSGGMRFLLYYYGDN